MKPATAKNKFRKGIYLLNFVFFMVPITYFGYQPLLRYCASIVVIEDPIPAKRDAILVLAGGGPERAWGGADLYNQKLADHVVLTTEQSTYDETELAKRGIELVDGQGNYVRVLRGLGVPDDRVAIVHTPVDDTVSELQSVRELCLDRNWKSLIIVTTNYHTRRARLAARYVFGPEFQLTVVESRHDGWKTDSWWKTRGDVRTFLIEFEKLVAYTLYIGPRVLAREIWTSLSDTSPSSTSLETKCLIA